MKRKREVTDFEKDENNNNKEDKKVVKMGNEEKWNLLFQSLENICKTNKLLKEFLVSEVEKETERQKELEKKQQRSTSPRARSPRRSRSPMRKKEDFVDDGRRIVFEKRRTPLSDLKAKYGENIDIIDVSKEGDYSRLHPAFPLFEIPIPGNTSAKYQGVSVMGIYEGLKVFENDPICKKAMGNVKMRVAREPNEKRGKLLGYKYGLMGNEILDEKEAREKIFLPTYKHVLEKNADVKEIISALKAKLNDNPSLRLVLVDSKDPNVPLNDFTKPISHAVAIRDYLEDNWPETLD